MTYFRQGASGRWVVLFLRAVGSGFQLHEAGVAGVEGS
jgi:hypothetical protein